MAPLYPALPKAVKLIAALEPATNGYNAGGFFSLLRNRV
jgi:hypothetical protein